MPENEARTARWDQKFLEVCETLAKWSTCKSRKIGAILVRNNTIVSTGYNGPPRNVPHCGEPGSIHQVTSEVYGIYKDKTVCPRKALGYNSGEGLHLCPAAHAEDNAITNAARLGVPTVGTTIYMNCGVPCRECLKRIINAGILEIVCVNPDDWYDNLSKFLVKEAHISVRAFLRESEETNVAI
jgi:dCMP deaminase